jgi:uncharacterized protein YraI
LAALLIPPGATQAQAQLAVTAKNAHLRAGPARDYPVVAILPMGLEISVQGCLSDYSWCDVIVGPSRGWMYAGNISYAYNGAYVPLITYGAEIGVGVVGFILFDYWTLHYHNRPWYRDREEWVHRHGPGWPVRPGVHPRAPGYGAPGAPRPFDRDRAGLPRSGPPDHDRPGPPQGRPSDHGRPGTAHPESRDRPGGRDEQHPQPSQPRARPGQHPQAPQPRGPATPRPQATPPSDAGSHPRRGDRGGG